MTDDAAASLRPRPRDAIQRMAPYSPPTSSRMGRERLDFNENTIGCSPKVIARLREIATPDLMAIYPEYSGARETLGSFFGVGADQITFSDGTDEGIHVTLQTFVEPGDEVLMPWPTFPMYRFYVEVADAKPVLISYREPDLSFPTEELIAAIGPKTRGILIANPNNPTGCAIGLDVVERILQSAPGAAVLIDEAYFEFYGVTAIGLIPRYPNLVVTRTFSKTYGLAALRVGCVMSQAENIAAMRKGQSPYSVNTLGIECAIAAVQDQEYIRNYVAEVLEARTHLLAALDRMGVRYFPTQANFVLTEMGDRAAEVVAGMRERGILVRNRSNERAGAVRFTVGTMDQTKRLIAALEEILAR